MANTYGLNVIKIRGMWIFWGGGRSPLLGGVTCDLSMPIFELGWATPVKSHVWKFGLNRLSLSRVITWIFRGGGGQKPPIRCGYMWPAMPIFELGPAIPVKSHMWKFGLDWLSLSRVIVFTNIFLSGGGRNPLLGGGYIWPVMPIFELGWAIPVKSHVWKFGLDWLKSEVC